MALTPSKMLALGTEAPDFALSDTDGRTISLQETKGKKPFVVMFICNHCPYVKHIREALALVTTEYLKKGIGIFAINSNDVENYPEDSPEKMAEEKRLARYEFPYLFDADQSVAKAYEAACTPDFYLFDRSGHLVYRGQFDESRPGNAIPVTGSDLRKAMDSLIEEKEVSQDQRPSIGCNIKWKK